MVNAAHALRMRENAESAQAWFATLIRLAIRRVKAAHRSDQAEKRAVVAVGQNSGRESSPDVFYTREEAKGAQAKFSCATNGNIVHAERNRLAQGQHEARLALLLPSFSKLLRLSPQDFLSQATHTP